MTISIRTLCLVSTGPSTSSSSHPRHFVFLRATHLAVQHAVCRIVFRRPTARFNPGVCLCIWPFPRRHSPSHMPTFSAASRCIRISSISTARSHKSQNICHVHDGLDWPRLTRHSSCHVSVRDMSASTSVSSCRSNVAVPPVPYIASLSAPCVPAF